MKRAVFLDRDGTIVDDPGFLRDPASVHLLPGAAPALHRLQQLGLVLVVVSNQSGIGRGLITTTELDAVNREVARQLAHHGVEIGGWYHCPHLPDAGCDCRKPGTLLHREAARDLEIDLASSWWIGDRTSDLIPARELGGRGILVTSGHGQNHRSEAHSAGFEIATGISEAAEMIARDLSGALPAILPPVSYRVAVAVSGRGSNLLALAEALARAGDPARIVTVISDRDAAALIAARERGWGTHRLADPGSAAEWLAVLDGTETDLLVLAGYLRLVPPEVVMARRGRIINIHPALLPDFGGPGMYGSRVHRAVLASGVTRSGATVHLVDEQYDRGAILGQASVPVLPDDTPESLAARVLEIEHRLLPAAVLAAAAAGRPEPFSLFGGDAAAE